MHLTDRYPLYGITLDGGGSGGAGRPPAQRDMVGRREAGPQATSSFRRGLMKHKISMAILAMVVALTLAAPAFGATPAKALRGRDPHAQRVRGGLAQPRLPGDGARLQEGESRSTRTPDSSSISRAPTRLWRRSSKALRPTSSPAPAPSTATSSSRGGFIFQPQNFCRNKLVVIIPKKNPARLHVLQDLTKHRRDDRHRRCRRADRHVYPHRARQPEQRARPTAPTTKTRCWRTWSPTAPTSPRWCLWS